jgi:hypothetical protein
MFIAILNRYLFTAVACVALLAGLQAPNLADQYQKRVDSHLREVAVNLRPFQDIADRYFGGDIALLIERHRASDEKPFQEEGAAIEKMVRRQMRFRAELAALNVALPWRIAHVLLRHDREIMDETLAQYTWTLPLNADALATGGAFTLTVLLALELLLALGRMAIARPRAAKPHGRRGTA